MTKNDNQLGKFDLFFKKYIDVNKVPFYSFWVLKQVSKIIDEESTVKRKGLPKTGPRPMVRDKQLLVLLKTIEKLTLKDFAECFGVSYGVVRLWNREPQVEKKATEFMMLFAADYIVELEKRVLSKKLDIEKYSLETTEKARESVNIHMNEVKHYHYGIQYFILSMMESKVKDSPNNQSFVLAVSFLYIVMTLSDWSIFNPPKDKKTKELFEQNIKRRGKVVLDLQSEIFSDLKKMIKNGETKKALKLCDWVKAQTLDMIKSNTDLEIRILNKGRQKRKDKRGKTVKSIKKKEVN